MKYLALLLVLFAACLPAPLPAPVFGVDLAFDSAEVQQIILAAGDWNAHTDGEHQIRLELADPMPFWWVLKAAPPEDFAGYATRGELGHHIWLRPGLSLPMIRAAARHEFGHALGMKHIPPDVAHGIPHNTMQATAYEDSQLSPADIIECRRAGACP